MVGHCDEMGVCSALKDFWSHDSLTAIRRICDYMSRDTIMWLHRIPLLISNRALPLASKSGSNTQATTAQF